MKIIIIKGNLKEGLDVIDRSSGDSATLPILKNILIETTDNKIKLVATNLELACTAYVSGKIIEPGRVTVPASVLREIISNLQSERLNLETENNSLKIKTDNYEASIQGMPAEDFPIVPKIKEANSSFEIKGSVLKDALSQVVSSAQTNNVRPELSSILWNFSLDELKLVATDSFRLSEKTLSQSQFKGGSEETERILIPIKTAQEIHRILKDGDTALITTDNNQICFKGENFELISRLTEGSFPDYTAIVPKSFETEVVLDREELVNGLKVVGVFSTKINEIKIKIREEGKVIEIFSNDQAGENNYLIPCKTNGKEKEISFNWRYLLDGLKNIKSKDVFWGINEDNKPALLKAPNDASYFYVLMPILKT